MINNLSHVSHRSTLFFFAIGVLFIVVGFKVFSEARSFSAPGEVPLAIAKIESVTNFVKVKHSRDFLWNDVTVGQRIENNSFVYADKKSQAVISYKDGSKLVLLPGSIVEIVSSKNGKFDFKVEKGRVISVPASSSKLNPEAIVVTEPGQVAEDIVAPFIYLVDTQTKALLRELRPATFRISWKWSGVPQKTDRLVLKVSGPKKEEIFPLTSELSFIDLQLKNSGAHDWFIYLNDELMSGGSVDFYLLGPPLLKSLPAELVSDTGLTEFGWDYSKDIDFFEVEILSTAGATYYKVPGDQRKFIKQLELNGSYSWRVRSYHGQLAGPWSLTETFFLKSKKPYFLDQMNQLLAQIEPLHTFNNLPDVLDLNIDEVTEYSIDVIGSKKIAYAHFQIKTPGTYTVEIQHLKSGYKSSKSLKVDLSSIQETLVVPESQEIKILEN